MASIEFKTLEEISDSVILETFNLSFSDYIIPFHLTQEQLSEKMKSENTDLSYSVGAFVDGNLVGFILHGYDQNVNGKKVLYNGGTGVIPSRRGLGLTRRMYEFILPQVKNSKIDHLILEVISNNIPAIKSYEKVGYKLVRELDCYKGEVKLNSLNSDLEIKAIESMDWNTFQSFWDTLPSWQHSKQAVEYSTNTNHCLGAFINEKLVGYVIFNPTKNRIVQLAVSKNERRKKVASSLIDQMIRMSNKNLSVINVDRSEITLSKFFSSIGLELFLSQNEMEFSL